MNSRGIMIALIDETDRPLLDEALEELLTLDPYPGNGEWEASNGVKLALRRVN